MCKNGILWNSATYSCKNGKYLESIIYDSVPTYDEIIETTKSTLTKTFPTKTALLNKTSTNFYILLAFLSITISLLMAVSIYYGEL